MKSGVIYKPGEKVQPVSIRFAIYVLKFVSKVLNLVGGAMIGISFFGLFFVYLPLGMAEAKYAVSKTRLAKIVNQIKVEQLNSGTKIDATNKLSWEVPDINYSIYIPKIFAKSKVIANVDAGNEKEYVSALRLGVAEAAGLSHPGKMGTTYLFAHSVGSRVDFARYNAVFYLLDKLTIGDEIEIVYQNKLYKYQMVEREILGPSDTKYLVPQNLSEKLVLQTCYPPGTTWKRLVVVAKRSS